MNILVTGSAGYIGSHVLKELFSAGHTGVIIDDFSNSEKANLERINKVAGQEVPFYEGDFADGDLLEKILQEQSIGGVIHIAAFKFVGESVENPLKYYRNNVGGFIDLVEFCIAHDLPLIFSSSAAVYGETTKSKVDETDTPAPINAYGTSKLMDEMILADACRAKQPARGIALRYFNVVGADESGLIGETLTPQSQNLWPIVVKVATGQQDKLTVFGDDFDTADGTCLRDYVHVSDLADAHIKALEHLAGQDAGYYEVFNVGTSRPTSVFEFIDTFKKVSGIELAKEVGPRRPGDPAAYYAVCDKIEKQLGWKAKFGIEEALASAWKYQQSLD